MGKFIGQAMHRGTAAALDDAGSTTVYRTLGPDFKFVYQGGKYLVELTTKSQVAVSTPRGLEYAEPWVVTYRWPGFIFF
jgi:hypothetical protein